ncbi:hypothetical protein [Chitinophaga sp. Cy-1792]|uniref:hypothetical protein n=1 Tax=Chitinophaga sp. Cy-1792 TaxID=2608339 RepID=UPI001423D0A8|nr:hypothetical protein [Chitinophaga sp. Cy-1792]NIG56581.1 hypothetical protein [Chitinophaga sp. Cy-1792]
MPTQNLGHPRIGGQRQLNKASKNYLAGKIDLNELNQVAGKIRQPDAGIALVAGNQSRFDQYGDCC